MEIFNKKPYVITIIILIVLILGLGGYIAYDKLIIKEDEAKVITVVDDVNINLNAFYQVSSTLERLDKAFNNSNSNYYGYIYKNKKLNIKNFDKYAALYASISSEVIPSNVNQTIAGDRLKSNYIAMFGSELKYNPEEFNINETVKVNYDKTNDMYSYTMPVNTDVYKSGYITKSVKTILDEDKIIVTRKVFYVEYNGKGAETSSAAIYTNHNKDRKLGDVTLKDGQANIKEVISKYGSRLSTFEYIFIKNTDEDYSLTKIEKIR